MKKLNSKEILKQLDDCSEEYAFPMLDNGYVYTADSRLSIYRDNSRWALLIEVIGYNHKPGDFHEGTENTLYFFGNCLECEPGLDEVNFLRRTAEGDAATFVQSKDTFDTLNPEATFVLVQGKPLPIAHDREFYTSRGVELEEPPYIFAWEFLRGFVPEHRELFLASDEEIRERIPKDLPLLLRLEEWYHGDPNWPDNHDGQQKPSEIETFQMIAKMIESGDVRDYCPSNKPNNHWKNWPEGGKA